MERYGECGAPLLAKELGLPVRTWLNFESGVVIPGPILLRFIDRTGANPRWLMTGTGEPYAATTTVAVAAPLPSS